MKIFSPVLIFFLIACSSPSPGVTDKTADSTAVVAEKPAPRPKITAGDIRLEKELLFDKYILEDTYPYRDTVRKFQWDKISEILSRLENLQREAPAWGILQNRKNDNGEAPLTHNYRRNAYKRISDTLGVERYQGTPLYLPSDTLTPELYGQDGSLVRWRDTLGGFVSLETVHSPGSFLVPRRYVRFIDTVDFRKVIFVDRTNENIAVLEKKGEASWLIRSTNPATTGLHRPPYMQETPLGIFVIQQKKAKMIYLVDGSTETGGFAPYASRFSNGGYIHGIPVNAPHTALVEYSPSLGTTPRSHMCVRNATSHAKFIYDWAPVEKSLVVVLE